MKISFLLTGKTTDAYIIEGIKTYEKRIKRYLSFQIQYTQDLKNTKNLSKEEIKNKEGILLLKQIEANDFVILLDEHGKQYRSLEFAQHIQGLMNRNLKRVVFVIGGPYGFSKTLHERANGKLSLSKMTFSHQIIRLLFMEQLYRAFSILNHEPYHHE